MKDVVKYYLATSKVRRQKKILLTSEEFIAQNRKEKSANSEDTPATVIETQPSYRHSLDEQHHSSSDDETAKELISELGITVGLNQISTCCEVAPEGFRTSPTSKIEPITSTSHRMAILVKKVQPILHVLDEDVPFRLRDELVAVNAECLVNRRWQESMNIIKSTIKSSYSDKLELIVKRKYKMPFSQVKSNETYLFL
ncbi:hypothetical protein GUITHDRAFT_150530, partial [Guillardia theta CCMP2712]